MPRNTKRNPSEYWFSPAPPMREIPELAYAGRYTAREATPMSAHRHDCLEICYVERGMAEWWIERKSYTISGGNFVFIRPHELHGGINKIHQPCRYFYVGLRMPRGRLLHLPPAESRRLIAAVNRLPIRKFSTPDQAGRLFNAVIASIGKPSGLSVIEVRANLIQILLMLVSAGSLAKSAVRSNVVSESIKLMEANIEHPLQLDVLAGRLGWSISHLKGRFRKEMGTSPGEYYLRLRIKRACAELRNSGAEITSIALRLGFASSQYFATAFKRIVGTTPREFRVR